MTIFEQDFMSAMISNSAEISKQLKIANELKALELKLKYPYPEEVGMVDNIADQI